MSQITTETRKKVVRQYIQDGRILKAELVNQYNFQTDEERNRATQEFAYLWYN